MGRRRKRGMKGKRGKKIQSDWGKVSNNKLQSNTFFHLPLFPYKKKCVQTYKITYKHKTQSLRFLHFNSNFKVKPFLHLIRKTCLKNNFQNTF
jgi:hypothetical protein